MRALGLALGLALALLASSARADARVGLSVSGRGAGAVRAALERGLAERGFTVLDAGEVSLDAVAMRAEALDAALVVGTVTPRRRRLRVDLRVFDRAGVERARVERRVARGREERLVAAVADALGAPESAPVPPAPTAEASAPASPSSASEPVPTPPADPMARDAGLASPVTALVQLGGGVRSRALEIVSPDGVDAGYRAEAYTELTVRAEARVFDVAFVRASFGTSVGLRSEREDPRLGVVESWFAWVQAEAGAAALLDGTVELGGLVGLGWDRYGLAFNELVPTAEYVHLRPAALLGVRLVGRALVLQAEGAVRIPFGVGDFASVHGVEHEVVGADGVVRLLGIIDPGFAWAVEFGARRYWLTFTRPDGVARGTDGGWHATAWAGWSL